MPEGTRYVDLKTNRKEVEKTVSATQEKQQAESFKPYVPGLYLATLEKIEEAEDALTITLRLLNGPNHGRQLRSKVFKQSRAYAELEKTDGEVMWVMLASKPRRDGKGYFTYASQFFPVKVPEKTSSEE